MLMLFEFVLLSIVRIAAKLTSSCLCAPNTIRIRYGAQFAQADSVSEADDPMSQYLSGAGAPKTASADGRRSSTSASDVGRGTVSSVVPLSSPEDVKLLSALRSGLELFEQKLERAQRRGGGVRSDRALNQMYAMHPRMCSRLSRVVIVCTLACSARCVHALFVSRSLRSSSITAKRQPRTTSFSKPAMPFLRPKASTFRPLDYIHSPAQSFHAPQ